MPTYLVNPTNETRPERGTPPPRLGALSGSTIALLDISQPGGSIFLDHIEMLLMERYGVRLVLRREKPASGKAAPAELIAELIGAGSQAVIEALADGGSCTMCSVHDTVRLEKLGVPSVVVTTHEFITAARAQASALGRPDFDAVYVPHPIQDQTLREIEAKADDAVSEIVARLTIAV